MSGAGMSSAIGGQSLGGGSDIIYQPNGPIVHKGVQGMDYNSY